MRKTYFIGIFLLMVIMLVSCSNSTRFSLEQKQSNIEKVEIVFISNHTDIFDNPEAIEICAGIDAALFKSFCSDLSNVACYRYVGDRVENITDYAIRITYCDGAYEVIGKQSVYYERNDGSFYFPSYHFDENEFTLFINSYLW